MDMQQAAEKPEREEDEHKYGVGQLAGDAVFHIRSKNHPPAAFAKGLILYTKGSIVPRSGFTPSQHLVRRLRASVGCVLKLQGRVLYAEAVVQFARGLFKQGVVHAVA